MYAIWRWRTDADEPSCIWTNGQARAYLAACLQAALVELRWKRTPTSAASCHTAAVIEILRHTDPGHEPEPARDTERQQYVLFFDGGSRGSPGPGGSGTVIVRTSHHATQASIIWSAAMSSANQTTTNNQAEYGGLIVGLKEALAQQWIPIDVVGDSQLILGKLKRYAEPRNARLRQLYAEARRLGDRLGVRRWIHHLRGYNKMADAAANAAMDTKTSSQVLHPTNRAHHASLARHLGSDFAHWQSHHFARVA